jgi:hypothetical protein
VIAVGLAMAASLPVILVARRHLALDDAFPLVARTRALRWLVAAPSTRADP